MYSLPQEKFTYKGEQGVLISLQAVFDHPSCGVRLESSPNLDTGSFFTITALMTVGMIPPETSPIIRCRVPPLTVPGYYALYTDKEWPWEEWLRLHLFNSDTVNHWCLGYGYTLCILEEELPALSESDIKELQFYADLYPEQKTAMADMLKQYVKKEITKKTRKVHP